MYDRDNDREMIGNDRDSNGDIDRESNCDHHNDASFLGASR